MRVMTAGPGPRPLARGILGFFYFYFFLHWGTGLLMFGQKLGFSHASVVRYYRGEPDLFMEPRSFAGLLEVTHFHLFAMGLFFVVFTHLLVFTPFRERLKAAVTALLATGLLLDMAAGWLVRYIDPAFAWAKLAGFWMLQTISLLLLLGLVSALLRSSEKRTVSNR